MKKLFKFTLTCLSTAVVLGCAIPRDVPVQVDDKQKDSLLGRFANLQSRLNALNKDANLKKGGAGDADSLTQRKYDWGKAQCWVRNAYSEYHENDPKDFKTPALNEAEKIIQGLEAGNSTYKDTLLVNHSERVRADLWAQAQGIQGQFGFKCAAPDVGCLEVQLSRSGHELNENGWRNANSYLGIAEDMVQDAQTKADACKQPVTTKTETAPAASLPPQPVSFEAIVYFNFDKRDMPNVRPQTKQKLDEFIAEVKSGKYNIQAITVSGHADRLNSTGKLDYNLVLAQDRAEVITRYLIGSGVANSLISKTAEADQKPVVNCAEKFKKTAELEECLLQNRRVEVKAVGTGK